MDLDGLIQSGNSGLQSSTQSSSSPQSIKWIRRSLLSALRELELRITAGKLRCCNDLLSCWVWIELFLHPPVDSKKKKKRNHHNNQVNKTPVIQYRGRGCRVTLGSSTLLWYFTPFCFHSVALPLGYIPSVWAFIFTHNNTLTYKVPPTHIQMQPYTEKLHLKHQNKLAKHIRYWLSQSRRKEKSKTSRV